MKQKCVMVNKLRSKYLVLSGGPVTLTVDNISRSLLCNCYSDE